MMTSSWVLEYSYHCLSAERLLIHRSQRAQLIRVPQCTRKPIRCSILSCQKKKKVFLRRGRTLVILFLLLHYLHRTPLRFLQPKLQLAVRTPSLPAAEVTKEEQQEEQQSQRKSETFQNNVYEDFFVFSLQLGCRAKGETAE